MIRQLTRRNKGAASNGRNDQLAQACNCRFNSLHSTCDFTSKRGCYEKLPAQIRDRRGNPGGPAMERRYFLTPSALALSSIAR